MTLAASHDGFMIDEHVYRRRWWTLAVLCTSLVIVIVGNTSLNVALPTLARELDASSTQLQWMVDAYALVFAGFLFTAGALGDRYGRKGALQIGLLIFLAGCLLAAFLETAEGVILGRAVMGLGAAFVMPSTLSVLANVFPPHERTKAIAIWAGISGAGAALGPIASGFLLEHFSWGAVFFVNVPIILLALVAGWFLVPRSSDPEHARLDPVGALLSIGGLSALVYSIIEAPHHGWASVTTLAWFAGALVLIGCFIAWELHSRHPMLDLHWFRDRRFSVASGGITLVFFAMFGTFFLITQYFQLVLGYSALEAGIKQLPVAAMMVVVAPQTPRFSARFGANRVTGVGLAFVGAGLLVLGMLGASTPYAVVVLPMLMISGGMALTIAPFTGSIMSAVPPSRAGVGSAMNDTTRELGGALGVAVLGSLVLSQYQSAIDPALAGLPEAARAMADSGLAGALQVAAGLEPSAGAELVSQARDAFLTGMGFACTVGAVVVAIAGVMTWRLLPSRPAKPRVSAAVGTEPDTAESPGLHPAVEG
jgi:EmrB/QacA subfamily drug resistance transporter